MKIQIDGAGMINKGAELMLFSVLKQIEKNYPNAQVLINNPDCDVNVIHKYVNLDIKIPRTRFLLKILFFPLIKKSLDKLKLQFIKNYIIHYPRKNTDLLLDAGGFQFGDQFYFSTSDIYVLNNYYRKLKKYKTKIIFLPQAFGPFEKKNSKKLVTVFNNYIDTVYAREKVSYNYLIKTGLSKTNLKLYPDFTSLTKGIMPSKYDMVKEHVCFIPNMRMLDKGALSIDNYVDFFVTLIKTCIKNNNIPFLLNHEGESDYKICKIIAGKLDTKIIIANNLNGFEIKGIIANSYAVVSSRFHGVASSLSSAIPCLATSWNHKYKLLFEDYGQTDNILDVNNVNDAIEKLSHILDPKINGEIKTVLEQNKKRLTISTEKMWEQVFNKKR